MSGLNQGVHQKTQAGVNYSCPCCGYPTLYERGSYEICPLCFWEDDGQDDPHADEVWGGPNYTYSLTAARENFKRHWVMYSPENDTRISAPDNETEIQAKKDACTAFDLLVNADAANRERLMQKVKECYTVLRVEMTRKQKLYESRFNN